MFFYLFIYMYTITRTAPNIGGVAVKGLGRGVRVTVVWRRRANDEGVETFGTTFQYIMVDLFSFRAPNSLLS